MAETNFFFSFTRRLESLGVQYMVTGGVAAIVYGEPRFTRDVDLVVALSQEQAARLPAVFPLSEFYCPPEEVLRVEIAREQRGHFNIIEHATGFKADVYLAGGDALHAWGLANVRRIQIDEDTIVIAPPEYVIVRKLEYFQEGGSEKHLRDIRSMLSISQDIASSPDIERLIRERHLQDVWGRVLANS